MKINTKNPIVLSLLSTIISGCMGYDRALLVTKTNIGLDVDTKPPTAEITIARRELAIQPTFPEVINDNGDNLNENALPLLASFNINGVFNPSISGKFAGGDAAINLTNPINNFNETSSNSSLCLSKHPEDTRSIFLKAWHWIINKNREDYEKEPRPFYFATDTTYGVKAAWSGTSGPYPDSLKIGYNRKEFASPPIYIDKGCNNNPDFFNVKLPSFYASIDNKSGWESLAKANINQVQFFATGKAASKFTERASVRQYVFEKMAPEAAKIEASELNKSLINEINTAFSKADSIKQQSIVNEAITLELVPKNTISSTFIDKIIEVTH